MSSSFNVDTDPEQNEDDKSANVQIMAGLEAQVQRAEKASEQYRKQLESLQQRLDDATNEQTTAEEREYQRRTELDRLRADIKDGARQRREQEITSESEKRMLLQERERQTTREAELQSVIGRLNETLRNKGIEKTNASRAGEIPSTMTIRSAKSLQASMPVPRSPTAEETVDQSSGSADVKGYLNTIQDREATIEDLKLELAEFHLKTAEQEHEGDGRLQTLEKVILETKMQNARLVEENESFQMLLSEKTLKGGFNPDEADTMGLSTLAEELDTANDDPEAQTETLRRLEAENRQLKEQNKGLTLYIDKIIGRILQHEGLEHIIVNKDEKPVNPPPLPAKPAPLVMAEKALPATPGTIEQDISTPTQASMAGAAAGFLQRAKSVVSRSGNTRPPRPMSYAQAPPPTANENPVTAPSIPFNRGHRRARSDQAQQDVAAAPRPDLAAAAVVQQMHRGSPLRTASGGIASPGISPMSPQLKPSVSYFPNATPQTGSIRAPSGSLHGGGRGSSGNSISSDHSLDRERSSTDASSGPSAGPGPNIPGAVMKQSQLRPLRLVQERSREDEDAQKRLNRGSWMGWFKGSTIEAQNDEHGP